VQRRKRDSSKLIPHRSKLKSQR